MVSLPKLTCGHASPLPHRDLHLWLAGGGARKRDLQQRRAQQPVLQWASSGAPVWHPSGSRQAWFGQRDHLIGLLGGNDQQLPVDGCNLVLHFNHLAGQRLCSCSGSTHLELRLAGRVQHQCCVWAGGQFH